jgi:putative membrane protein
MDEPRRPLAIRLDDPDVKVAAPDETVLTRAPVIVRPSAEPILDAPVASAPPAPRRGRWGVLFSSALTGLVSLALGLAATRLIEDLFARADPLGYLGLGLLALAVLAALVLIGREILGLARLRATDRLRARAEQVLVTDDRAQGRAVVDDLLSRTATHPHLAKARADLARHTGEIIDGADLIRLAERGLMTGPDAQARDIVSAAAKRVSLVTALSPRALVDMLFVLVTTVSLIRKLSQTYGGRPGGLALAGLVRRTLTHVALTGGIAAGDSLVQQLVGHGLTARVSAKLGEGVLNGLLTARLGMAAIELIRPLPFAALPKPALQDLARDLVTKDLLSRTPASEK